MYDIQPEVRISLIGITEDNKVLLKKSPERWGKLLTVPGRKLDRENGLLTLKDLISDLGLTLLSEPEFLPPPQFKPHPLQYEGQPTYFVFCEYKCLVEGTPTQGEFYSLYELLNENRRYRAKPHVENVNLSLLVEDITFDVLEKHVGITLKNNLSKIT